MTTGVSQSRIPFLTPSLLCALLVALAFRFTAITPERDGRGHDGRFYAAMAHDERHSEPFVPVAPFCYRVLTPALADLSPGPVVQRFRVVAALSWWAALTAFFILLRRHGLSTTTAYIGCGALATCAWGPVASLYNPCYVDATMYLFVIVGLILVQARSAWLAVLLPIAMLQREQTLIVWICSLVAHHRRGEWNRRVHAWHGAILAACVAALAGLHGIITPVFDTAPQQWRTAFSVLKWMGEDPTYAVKSILAVGYALGLPLVATCLLPEARRWIRTERWPIWYLALSALTLLCGSDKARLVFLAQPVLILAGLHGLCGLLRSNHSIRSIRPGVALATLALLHVYMQLPPHLMLRDGRIQAPLVDEMDRGTHGANALHGPGYWPVSLSTVALHVLGCAALGAAVLRRMQTTALSTQSPTDSVEIAMSGATRGTGGTNRPCGPIGA